MVRVEEVSRGSPGRPNSVVIGGLGKSTVRSSFPTAVAIAQTTARGAFAAARVEAEMRTEGGLFWIPLDLFLSSFDSSHIMSGAGTSFVHKSIDNRECRKSTKARVPVLSNLLQ
jgi:hypothetical protein